MMIFGETQANFREVMGSVSHHIEHLPPGIRNRLAAWMLVERIIRKPALPPPGKQLPRSVQHVIENQVSLFTGYMVVFAHDDAVDKYNLATVQIYQQLARCLAAFLMGMSIQKEIITAGSLRMIMKEWFERLRDSLINSPEMIADLPFLFENLSLLRGIHDDEAITIQHLFFVDEYDALCREWLNMTIVGALGMGQAFHTISGLVSQYLAEDETIVQARCAFLVAILVRCMYAQAHSPEQKNLDTLRYGRYIELAYLKSTVLLDIREYVNDQVNEQRFFATRHNSSRYCDQFTDDLQDFEEDTRDGILGILHIYVIEQGLLAEKFLAMSDRQVLSISMVKNLLSDTKILHTTYDQTYIYHNPFIQAARDEFGNLRMGPADAGNILREIWVNAPGEVDWTIEALAKHRLALYLSFKDAWQQRNHQGVLDAIYRSNFPFALLRARHHFVTRSKWVIIKSHKRYYIPLTGYIIYYSVYWANKSLWFHLWIKKMMRSRHIGYHLSRKWRSV